MRSIKYGAAFFAQGDRHGQHGQSFRPKEAQIGLMDIIEDKGCHQKGSKDQLGEQFLVNSESYQSIGHLQRGCMCKLD